MSTLMHPTIEPMDDVIPLLARRALTPPNMIHLFSDSTEFLSTLFRTFGKPTQRIIAAGHVTPDVAIAADRAEMGIHEVLGASAFSFDTSSVLESVASAANIIYVSNPNRVSSATLPLAELRELAEAIPDGLLVVDEYYFEFFGITAVPLLEVCSNVVVLRSLTAAFGLTSSDVGYAVAHPGTFLQLGVSTRNSRFTATVRKTAVASLMNDQALSNYLQNIHDESLRMATALNRMGIRSRITASDSLLIRVANVTQVGNILARHRVPVENLDGYPRMSGFIRYRIQSQLSNDKCLEAFAKIPAELVRTSATDLAKHVLRKGPESATPESDSESREGISRREVFRTTENS